MAENGLASTNHVGDRPKLVVGLGEAGMRYLGLEGVLPAGVQVLGTHILPYVRARTLVCCVLCSTGRRIHG